MLFIGVDLGTSAVKLLLMDEEGDIKKIVSREYPLFFPHPGWSEQKPEDWFAQSMEGIKELTAQTYPMHPVCFLWTLRIAAGQKKCLISAESQKRCFRSYMKVMK